MLVVIVKVAYSSKLILFYSFNSRYKSKAYASIVTITKLD